MMFTDDDFDRGIWWREVPDRNSCARFVAENYYASGYNNSNTYGYYNGGWEYRIVPLNTNLTQKGNDRKYSNVWANTVDSRIYVGTRVTGDDSDGNEHTGRVVNFSFREEDNCSVRLIWILDDGTMEKVALDPLTVRVDRSVMYMPGGREKARTTVDLDKLYDRRGRMNESYDIFSGGSAGSREKFREDDEVYRDAVVEMFEMDIPGSDLYYGDRMPNATLLSVLDAKFYGDLFEMNTIPVRSFLINKTAGLLGLGDWNSVLLKRALVNLMSEYNAITGGGTGRIKFKISDMSRNYMECIENVPTVGSYRDVYTLARVMMSVYRRNAGTGEMTVRDEKIGDTYVTWNANCTNRYYMHVLKYVVMLTLFRFVNWKLAPGVGPDEMRAAGLPATYMSQLYNGNFVIYKIFHFDTYQ